MLVAVLSKPQLLCCSNMVHVSALCGSAYCVAFSICTCRPSTLCRPFDTTAAVLHHCTFRVVLHLQLTLPLSVAILLQAEYKIDVQKGSDDPGLYECRSSMHWQKAMASVV